MQKLKEIKQNPNYEITRVKIAEDNDALRLIHKKEGFVHTFNNKQEHMVFNYETGVAVCEIKDINMFVNEYAYSHYNNEGKKFCSGISVVIKEELLELNKQDQLKAASKYLKDKGFKLFENKNVAKSHLNKSLDYLNKNKRHAVEIVFQYSDIGLLVADYRKHSTPKTAEFRVFEYNGKKHEPITRRKYDELLKTLEQNKNLA